jgi:hypothetical protein
MLDEVRKRKPDLAEHDSVRITFADGQAWAIPKPFLEIRPAFRNGIAESAYCCLTYGYPVDGLVAAVAVLDGIDQIASVVATIAADLLRRNYDLVGDEFDRLLAYRVDDTESVKWIERVIEVATGRHGRRRGKEETDVR